MKIRLTAEFELKEGLDLDELKKAVLLKALIGIQPHELASWAIVNDDGTLRAPSRYPKGKGHPSLS